VVVALAISSFLIAQRVSLAGLDDRPRNTDIWFVYPDGSVRFAALLYPAPEDFPPNSTEAEFTVAGPLVYSMGDMLDTEVIGGSITDSEVLPGPTGNQDLFYELFRIQYEGDGDQPYGINVETFNSAYVSLLADGTRLLLLGTDNQSRFAQVVVAVALPEDTQVFEDVFEQPEDPDNPEGPQRYGPYRQRTIDGWTVYYFDTTYSTGREAIQIEFLPGQTTPETPDLITIDEER